MKCNKRMTSLLLVLLCAVMMAALTVSGAMAALTAEATGACTNFDNEGIEYFVPISALADQANNWRGELTAEVFRSDGTADVGYVNAMELEVINSSPRYQCTDTIPNSGTHFSCNSFPANSLISGVYLRIKSNKDTKLTEDTGLKFRVSRSDGTVLLEANGKVTYPPYPCARNYEYSRDLVSADGSALVFNTSSDCTNHKTVEFIEQSAPFAMVHVIKEDKLHGKDPNRFRMEVSPALDFPYTITLTFQMIDSSGKPENKTVTYTYDGTTGTLNADNLDGKTNANLPITLIKGTFTVPDETKVPKDLYGNPDYPTNVDFDIKFWYENTEGTQGYNNSIFHFERKLNVQFAPYCTEDAQTKVMTGVASTLYDKCDATRQPFTASFVDEKTNPKGILVPTTDDGCKARDYCTDRSAVNVEFTKTEPAKAQTYNFITRKCADSACTSVTTTMAYPYSITVSDGAYQSRTYRNNGNIYHKPGTRTEINMKAFGENHASGPGDWRPFAITGIRLMAEEPGTYVIYGFVPKSEFSKVVPEKYAVKFYVTIGTTDDLGSCYTLANNGYFRAYWNDCLDYRQTQLLTFEQMPNAEEAWIRNTSAHGVHFPYVPEWSYVPQALEIASLTCRFEALSAAGRPGDGYCRPNDVYVPPYTKVTITGGTMYLASTPEYDEYRVAYARQDTYNISHLFFSVQVKACDNVKKIPDTGISLRSPLKVNQSVDAATSYVFTGNSLRIPAIGLGMETPIPIVHVYYEEGSADLGWDLSTLGNYVGELEGGSYLPYAGNSALTGHYYSMGVFKNLEYLNMDDEIIVYGNDGIKYTYRVVQKFLAQPTDVYEMFQQVGERSLTLVTCENYNIVTDEYERRQLIRATIDHQEPYTEGVW